jgi:Holliday junction resolvasome RuvABC endonuclease subunit
MNMLVAGVDASTTATGVSVMKDGELIYYELIAIDSKKEKDAYKRIKEMLIRICAILDKYKIDKIYMEKAICKGGNVDITIKLAYLSGGMSLYCIQKDIEFHNPLPSEWRKNVGIPNGRGILRDAQKASAIKAVKDEYGIDVGDDVAESICLARSAFKLPKFKIEEDI